MRRLKTLEDVSVRNTILMPCHGSARRKCRDERARLMTGLGNEQGVFSAPPPTPSAAAKLIVRWGRLRQSPRRSAPATNIFATSTAASPGGKSWQEEPACWEIPRKPAPFPLILLLAQSKALAMHYRPKGNINQPPIVSIRRQ